MPDNKQLTPAEAAAANARTEVDGYKALVAMTDVETTEQYEIANGLLTSIRDAEVAHEAERVKITQPLNVALRAANALFKPLAEELAAAKQTLSQKMLAFTRREQAERERKEREAEAEQRRLREEADARLADAAAAVAAGEEGAEAALEDAQVEAQMAEVAMPIAAAAPPPARGGHATRKNYKASVVDTVAFLRHVANLLERGDKTFEESVEIKLAKLNKIGNATQGSLKVPGIAFNVDEKLVARKSS